MNVTPELVAVVAVGVASLTFGVALFTLLWRLSRDVARLERDLRQEMRGLEREVRAMGEGLKLDMQRMGEKFSRDLRGTDERINRDARELGERVARLEGAVETNSALLRVLVAERQPEAAG